ncbi:MAG: hypothetical protein HQ517_01445 [SAR324 cluster bacterium]|nr:hypothetical protein [SAR324 cluster bacterium]
MRIVICMKQIRHIFARSGTDPAKQYLAEEDHVFRINPYDESALNLACDLKKENPGIEIVLLTMGPLIAEKDLRRCLAMGADRLVRVDIGQETEALDPWQKSILLGKAVSELGVDLTLCGKESLDRQNGQVGAFLAQQLGHSFVSAASQITILNGERRLEVIRKGGKGTSEVWECPLPAVVSVEQTTAPSRMTTLGADYLAERDPIQVIHYHDFKEQRKTTTKRTFAPCPRTKGIMVPDSQNSAFERIQQLLIGSRVNKQSKIIQDDVSVQVGEMFHFLQEQGYLANTES